VRRLAVLLASTLVLAGCGGDEGTATLWVTRDRGARVLLTATVPAGLTAMQALERKTDIDTRYGGRFVVSINGIRSREQHDWIYYLNGVALGRGAAEYRLRDGDVEWWDYTRWSAPNEVPAVVGAFPEPFVHGVDGKVPPAVVVGKGRLARALAKLVRGRVVRDAPRGANVLELRAGSGFRALTPRQFVIDPTLAGRLVRNPRAFRFRYAVP
jgi:hypothetical protein